MNKYELSPWHQPTTSGSVPHNSYVGSSVEYSPGVGVYGVCHPQPHPQFQFSPFTPGQGTAAEVPQRASYVPAQVPLASTFVQPQTATVTTTVQTTAFLSQTPSQATTCYSQCPQQAAPAVTEPSFLNQTAAVESLNTPSGGSSTRLSVGSPQRLTTTGNPLLFTNSSAETNQPSDLQASNSTAKSAQSSPASPLTQPVPAQPTLASKSSSNTEQSQGEPLIQSQKAPSEPRKWWAQKVRRQDPSEGNGSGNNSTTSGNSNSGSSNSSSDQITFKTDGSGSSLGPWKLQPQQPLPKKAENELIKARMYLEQVKKKPSDEFIKNRLEKIKMLNGGAPDWVPNNDSPVCTFCGKIFSVIIRRHHCRKCGGLFCGDCTNWKIRLAGDTDKKLVRVCTECFCACLVNGLGTFAGSAMTGDDDLKPKGGHKVTILCVTSGGANTEFGDSESLPEGKEERRRYLCVQEVINTETSYVEDLEALVNVYMNPIKASGTLTNEQFSSIFSNIEVLLPMHIKIVQDLKEDGNFVGRAFMSMCSFLKMYSAYCANQEKAIEVIEKLKTNIAFMKVLNDCQSDPRAKGQNLSSYIIKPVQRICKYPLLFRELISHTPKDNPDYKSLMDTKEKIDEVVMYINERKRRMEQQRKMFEILNFVDGDWEEDLVNPARYWIADFKVQGKALGRPSKISDYMLFLFNNLLVVTKIAGNKIPSQHSKPYTLKGFIPLTECKVIVISSTESEKNSFEVSRSNSSAASSSAAGGGISSSSGGSGNCSGGGIGTGCVTRFQFYCETEADLELIVKTLKSAIKDMQKLIFSGKMIGSDSLLASMTSNPTAVPAQQPASSSSSQNK